MAKSLHISVSEDLSFLKKQQKLHPKKFKAIQMLMLLKRNPKMSKRAMAAQLSASDKSIQTWRTTYTKEGFGALMTDKRGGAKEASITGKAYAQLSDRLHNPKEGFRSFVEIQQWLSSVCGIDMGYHAVNKFVKRKFGARLKVSRKSHVQKSPADEAVFKKPARTARTY